MKMYIVRAVSNSKIATSNGVVLGYVDQDSQSGGYPWVNNTFPKYVNKDYCETYMDWIATKTKMSEMSNGGLNFPSNVGIFISEFWKSLGLTNVATGSHVIKIKFEFIELDMTDIMNVKSRILRTITVEGLEADDWKTRDKAYYKVL